MSIEIRPFERRDRDQLTELVNRHVAAVVPGVALSVNAVLSQLEREPGEFIVDPWVAERRCLVAVDHAALVAAALVHRFRGDPDVGPDFRNAGDIRWLVCTRPACDAGATVLQACLDLFDQWQVERRYADCRLPVVACYGVPDTLPHVRALYVAAGFTGPARTEDVYVATCNDLLGRRPDGIEVSRTMGLFGARLALVRGAEELGFIDVGELDADLARSATAVTWTDVGNLHVAQGQDRAVVVPALYAAAAEWLVLGGVDRILEYVADDFDVPGYREELLALGFTRLVTNEVGWQLPRP
jgi:hypothetical protein